MIEERKRIEFLAEAAGGFRGLPMMLFGLIMIVLMLLNFWAEIDSQRRNYTGKNLTWVGTFSLISLVVFLISYPRLRKSFGNQFGQTQVKPKTLRSIVSNLLYCAPLLLGFIFGTSIDAAYHLPFSLTIAGVAIFAFALWWITYRGMSNSILYLSMVIFGISLIDWERILVLTDFAAKATFYRCLSSILLGLTYVVMGFVDNKFLRTYLRPNTPDGGSL